MITQEALDSIRHKTKDGRENRWSVMMHGSDHSKERGVIQGLFLAMYNLGMSYNCEYCGSCWLMAKNECTCDEACENEN